MRLDPDAISRLAQRLPDGTAIVSATNGKTTTAAMVASVLEHAGIGLVAQSRRREHGRWSRLDAARCGAARRSAIEGELGLFEVDEFWLDRVAAQLRPRAMVLGNLFRDQLDRYGELDTIADRWAALAGLDAARRGWR